MAARASNSLPNGSDELLKVEKFVGVQAVLELFVRFAEWILYVDDAARLQVHSAEFVMVKGSAETLCPELRGQTLDALPHVGQSRLGRHVAIPRSELCLHDLTVYK